ncbi:hypothetical protein ACFE04_004895 [Oxalis oulophora]
MTDILTACFVPCQGTNRIFLRRDVISRNNSWRRKTVVMVRNEGKKDTQRPTAYSSSISTDIPFIEIPGASFDQYIEDKPRVFRAMFSDQERSQRLNEEEWRIHMLPVDFFFLTVRPVVDMRLKCKSRGADYPPGVPPDITKLLELSIIRWELQGLDTVFQPSHFTLGVEGAMYPDSRGEESRLKGQMTMSISFVLPPWLAVIPEHVRKSVVISLLTRLTTKMKHKVNESLLADYSKYASEETSQRDLAHTEV